MPSIAILAPAVTFLIFLVYIIFRQHVLRRRLPPGPPALPLIGNLHQAPSLYPWRTYTKWHDKYGPVFSLQYGPATVIQLGTHKAARDLLDKRSAIYSSRPRSVMVGECISRGFRTLFLPYGDSWRSHHKLQASVLNVRVSEGYRALQDVESRQLLVDLLDHNDDKEGGGGFGGGGFAHAFHRYSASLIFALAYGIRMPRGDEPEVKAVDQIMSELNGVFLSTWLVDLAPWLNSLPSFCAPWKRIAQRMQDFEDRVFCGAMEDAEMRLGWNWTKQMREMKESKALSGSSELAHVLGVLYEAGSDTTTMALEVFVMAAVLHPEVVRKAQEELDKVVGEERMPQFEDMASLPYVRAIVKEVLRWRPIIPGGVPHAVTQDDYYEGRLIPKGAIIFPNMWAMSMDPNVYHEPGKFSPDRWIADLDLPFAAFGFGRRVCIGQHVGMNSLLINVARILWTFDIGHAYELHDGQKVRCEVNPMAFSNGFNSNPLPFKARFSPRSRRIEEVVRAEWEAAETRVDVLLGRPVE